MDVSQCNILHSDKAKLVSVRVWEQVVEGSSTYAMFPELFDHSQAEDVGYLRVHRETGGQDVAILTEADRQTHTHTEKTQREITIPSFPMNI